MRIPGVTSASALARHVPGVGQAAGSDIRTLGAPTGPARAPGKNSFSDVLRQSVSGLTELQQAADRAAESVATGDLSNLHGAVIAMQKASLAVELAVAVRNHLVDGIQELLRTQA